MQPIDVQVNAQLREDSADCRDKNNTLHTNYQKLGGDVAKKIFETLLESTEKPSAPRKRKGGNESDISRKHHSFRCLPSTSSAPNFVLPASNSIKTVEEVHSTFLEQNKETHEIPGSNRLTCILLEAFMSLKKQSDAETQKIIDQVYWFISEHLAESQQLSEKNKTVSELEAKLLGEQEKSSAELNELRQTVERRELMIAQQKGSINLERRRVERYINEVEVLKTAMEDKTQEKNDLKKEIVSRETRPHSNILKLIYSENITLTGKNDFLASDLIECTELSFTSDAALLQEGKLTQKLTAENRKMKAGYSPNLKNWI